MIIETHICDTCSNSSCDINLQSLEFVFDELTQVVSFILQRECLKKEILASSAMNRKTTTRNHIIGRVIDRLFSTRVQGTRTLTIDGWVMWCIYSQLCAKNLFQKCHFNQMSVYLLSCVLFKVFLLVMHLGWVVLKFEYSTILPNYLTFLPNFN